MNIDINLTGLDALSSAADCLKTLAHPHRLRITQMLLQGEFNVGELARACEIPSHMASEHLRLMSDRGLLHRERRGRFIYYRVKEEGIRDIMHCVESRYGCATKEDS